MRTQTARDLPCSLVKSSAPTSRNPIRKLDADGDFDLAIASADAQDLAFANAAAQSMIGETAADNVNRQSTALANANWILAQLRR